MTLLLLIIILVLLFGGGGYYGRSRGWYGNRPLDGAPAGGGMGLVPFLLIVLVVVLLLGGLGGPYMGYWHY